MQKVPPASNNPNNPLNKVATLLIEREDWKGNKASVRASLQFKLSHDMRGDAKDHEGQPVTISFALAINKAALQLTWAFEEPAGNARIRASEVAHLNPLLARRTVKQATEDSSRKSRSASANIGGSVRASGKGVTASVKAGAKGAIEKARRLTNKTTTDVEYEQPNMLATIDGGVIHWTISPHDTGTKPNLSNPSSYLAGEVFMEADGTLIAACILTRSGAKTYPLLDVQGVVKINVRDLVIEGVTFQDANGNELDWRQLDQRMVSDAQPTQMENWGLGNSIQARIMRQIIRKHLISRGLKTDGPYVEICSARS